MQDFRNKIFSKLNFYDWYSALSSRTRMNEKRLEVTDKKKVLEILECLGYKAKYVAKGSFYRIHDMSEDWEFSIHFCLKYGVAEIIFGLKKAGSVQGIGGTSSSICEDLQYYKGVKTEELIPPPSFDGYNVLTEIFKEALSIYETMKKEVLNTVYPTL